MFQIIKYIQPTWYFNLKPEIDWGYFPLEDTSSSENEIKNELQYFSAEAFDNYQAYLLHKKGFQNSDTNKSFDWWKESKIKITDEYRFARQNYQSGRVIMACMLRILFLHNPFKEIFGFLATSGTSKNNKLTIHELPHSYGQFQSSLIDSNPRVTVVIPTLNRYEYLNDVLSDLEAQDYQNFEVIIIDQSDSYNDKIYQNRKLNLRIIRQKEKALWLARNTAIQSSASDFLLLYDDDSRIKTNWITQHLKCIDYFNADISSGVSLSGNDKSIPEGYTYFKWSDQLDTGNVMIKRSVFEKSGLFDQQFEKQRMGDGEFGLRAYLDGFKNISNPLASRIHLKVGTGGLREMGNWDAFRPKSFWAPRPIPSVLYLFRKYFGKRAAIISLFINTPPSIIPYKFKQNRKLLFLGALITIMILPIVIIQVLTSWYISSKMLKRTAIPSLK